MKKVASLFAVLCLIVVAMPALASTPATTAVAPTAEAAALVLPQAPLFAAIADFEGRLMSGTCAVIRPIATHSQCNYFLCESHGCGAPFYFDPVDCACHCGYAY